MAVEHAAIGVAIGAQVQLLGPSFFRVKMAKEDHQVARELVCFLPAQGLSAPQPGKGSGRFSLSAGFGITVVQAMIREPAAVLMEVVVPLAQRCQEIAEPRDFNVRAVAELVYPFVEVCRVRSAQCAIRTKRGKYLRRHAR